MASDYGRLFRPLSKEFSRGARDKPVRGAVEAVLAESILAVVLLGDAIVAHIVGHRLVEGRVKDRHVRDTGENLLTGTDAANVGRHVQRAERDERVKALQHVALDKGRLLKELAAMQDTVADGVHVGQRLEDTDGGIDQFFRDKRKRLGVVLGLDGLLGLVPARAGVDKIGVVGADALNDALGENGLFGHVEESELEGGGTGIDDEDVPDVLLAATGHGETFEGDVWRLPLRAFEGRNARNCTAFPRPWQYFLVPSHYLRSIWRAWSSATVVMSAPPSMRAISCTRSSPSTGAMVVTVRPPSTNLRTTRCRRPYTATWTKCVMQST